MTRIALLTALALLVAPSMPHRPTPADPAPLKLALYCTLTGQKVMGSLRICFYNCKGDGYAKAVPVGRYCPLGQEPNWRG